MFKVGEKVSRWTILKDLGTRPVCEYFDKRANKKRIMTTRFFLCQCECGNKKEIPSTNLINGRSGGCVECGRKTLIGCKNNVSTNPIYPTWLQMVNRCTNPKHKSYENYGGRGIKVCDRWLNSFEDFYNDMGDKPSPEHTLDRINNDGNYEPSNCRWATMAEQANNKRITGLLTLAELSRQTGYTQERIRQLVGVSKFIKTNNELVPFVKLKLGKRFIFKNSAINFLLKRRQIYRQVI